MTQTAQPSVTPVATQTAVVQSPAATQTAVVEFKSASVETKAPSVSEAGMQTDEIARARATASCEVSTQTPAQQPVKVQCTATQSDSV